MKAFAALLGVLLLVLAFWWSGLRADAALEPVTTAPPSAAPLTGFVTPSEAADEAVVVRAPLEVQEPGLLPAGLAMPSPDAIHGCVVNELGVPQAGVAVRLWRLGGDPRSRGWFAPPEHEVLGRILTDAEGVFRFAEVRTPECGLTAESVGREEHHFPVAPGSWVEIRLGAGNRLAGQVRCDGHESETFAGTARLTIMVRFETWLMAPIAADGSFSFDSVPPGEYLVMTEIASHTAYESERLLLHAWGETVNFELLAHPGAVVAGRVVHAESGEPIEDAIVGTRFYDDPKARTDASGAFRLDQLPEGILTSEEAELFADKDGFLQGSTPLMRDAPVVIRMEPYPELPLRVIGTVLDADGRPVEGVEVRTRETVMLGERPDRPPLYAVAHTDHAGRFELRWIEDEDFDLTLTGVAGETYSLYLGALKSHRELGELRLQVQWTLALHCVDEAGNPVAGAYVHESRSITLPEERLRVPDYRWGPVASSSAGGITDVFGRCTLRVVEMEKASLTVRLGRSSDWSFPLPSVGVSEQTLVLEDLRQLTGRAIYADGRPVAGGALTLLDPDRTSSFFNPFGMDVWVQLTQSGEFQVLGRFSPRISGYLLLHELDVRGRVQIPEIHFDASPLTIIVPDPQPVSGIVRDAAGEPLADARVLLTWGDDDEAPFARTGADGGFSARVLLEPDLRIFALHGERRSPEQPLTASAPVVLVVPTE